MDLGLGSAQSTITNGTSYCSSAHLNFSTFHHPLSATSSNGSRLLRFETNPISCIPPSISTHSIPNNSVLNAMKASPIYHQFIQPTQLHSPPKSVTPDANVDDAKLRLLEREILKQMLIEQGNMAKVCFYSVFF